MIRILLIVVTAFAVGVMIGPGEVIEVACDAFRPFGLVAAAILAIGIGVRLLIPSRK